MTIVERIRAFFFAKRRWQWVLVGVAIVALGQYLDAKAIKPQGLAQSGVRLTGRLHDRLALAQPQMISEVYGRAAAGRHGIGLCGPTAATGTLELVPSHLKRHSTRRPPPPGWQTPRAGPSDSIGPSDAIGRAMAPLEREAGLPPPAAPSLKDALRAARAKYPDRAPGSTDDPFGRITRERGFGATPIALPPVPRDGPPPPPKNAWDCSRGWLAMLDSAALTLRTTPEVGYAVWSGGGWSATILFALTLLAVAAVLVALWRTKDIGCAAIPASLIILSAGPLAAAGMFWLMLQVLLVLTTVVGKVLAGLAILLGWIAVAWKLGMFVVSSLSAGDDAQKNIASLKATFGRTPDAN